MNVSRIVIPFSKGLAHQMKEKGKSYTEEEIAKYNLYANGCSLVIHPNNPFVPTCHANFRMLEIYDKKSGKSIDYWFGGGGDLTPNYLFEEDCIDIH